MKLVFGLLTLVLFLAGCAAGPNYLSRTVDDWQNQEYVENPIKTAVITDVLPGYPILKIMACVGDWAILNPTQFWFIDIWRGEGAAYKFKSVSGPQAYFEENK